MTKVLIVCTGYLGDHMFAGSVAQKLIEEGKATAVDYLVGLPQMIPFFERNPFIRRVWCDGVTPEPRCSEFLANEYDTVFRMPHITRTLPPAMELQLHCGIENPSSRFSLHTDPSQDAFVREAYGEKTGPVLAIMRGWKEKTFLFTREQYDRAIDVPNLGYGGSHRDTDYITAELMKHFNVIMVGMDFGVSQLNPPAAEVTFDLTASIIKYCDYFVGAEGGLANLAYAVGTSTIITSDFVHQLYGPKGVLQRLEEPKLGPVYYESDVPHHNLDPYLTDEEVVQHIIQRIAQ